MPIDKILQKLQHQIKEIGNTFESFEDDTIQPGVADCDRLRSQMNEFLECLAVYKHFKVNSELSPSFNIHAKLSEKVVKEEKQITPVEQEPIKQEAKKEPVATPPMQRRPEKTIAALSIGINDKFRFINELFSQNASEYHIVLEQLGSLSTWQETEIYLNSLKNVYGWKDNNEVVKYFYGLVKKRFE